MEKEPLEKGPHRWEKDEKKKNTQHSVAFNVTDGGG